MSVDTTHMSLLQPVVRIAARRRTIVPALALLIPLGALALLRGFPQLDVLFESADFHLVVVSAISGCALAVAVVVARAAGRTQQGTLVSLALGCLVLGVAMLGHGLATPGILTDGFNQWVVRLPVVAIGGFAVALALPTRPGNGFIRIGARHPVAVLVVPTATLIAVVALAVLAPARLAGSGAFPGEGAVRTVALLTSAAVLVAAGAVHWRRWRLSTDPVQFALTLAAWLTAGAAISLEVGALWHLSWWDYHGYLLAGFVAAVDAIVTGSRRDQAVDDALAHAFTEDPLEHISRGYSETLRALVGAVEARDAYTHGHSARVAEWSVRIGIELGLRAEALRALAEGAYLHDVGKIGIPDRILNKPGRLTDEERAWVEEHPVLGVDIAGRAPSLRSALETIRHHHERYDGGGYPDGLAGQDIPLAARITAVADVWDALTSDRAYREAWSETDALAHLIAGRGSHFDPACLDAFVELLADRGVAPPVDSGDVTVAERAARACHPDHDREQEPAAAVS